MRSYIKTLLIIAIAIVCVYNFDHIIEYIFIDVWMIHIVL